MTEEQRTALDAPQFRVAAIVNDREVAIAGGTDLGLKVGDSLRIISGTPTVIRDPDTEEVLGEIKQTKAVVRVYEVQPKFALARTFRTRNVNVGGQNVGSGAFGKIFAAPKWETRVETLERDPSRGKPVSQMSDIVVEVGDIAELVSGSVDDIPSSSIWR